MTATNMVCFSLLSAALLTQAALFIQLADAASLSFHPRHSERRSSGFCRSQPGDPGFPTDNEWQELSSQVGGRLVTVIPTAKFCHELPAGNCTWEEWQSFDFRGKIPGAMLTVCSDLFLSSLLCTLSYDHHFSQTGNRCACLFDGAPLQLLTYFLTCRIILRIRPKCACRMERLVHKEMYQSLPLMHPLPMTFRCDAPTGTLCSLKMNALYYRPVFDLPSNII